MKQYKTKNLKTKQNERQRSFEFIEYPQVQEYYSNQMNSSGTKPKRIIVTEIYDQKIPNVKNTQQRNEYFKYYTESSSPYSNQQVYNTIGEKRIFSQNKNSYFSRNQDMNMDSNFNQFFSDYNKKLYFGRTDLREEYPNPSNERVNIRKKVHRGSNTPQPMRNNYNLRNDEDFIENFQYYESKNIKDKNNKKYQSITRVTGYSNLVPLNNRKIETNIDLYRNKNFNSINLARYNNFKELKHNYSNVDVYNNSNLYSLKHQMIEKKKPQTPEKITKVQIQKTVKNYEIQKKPQITSNTNVQIQTSKRKYESSQLPQTTTKTTKTTNIVQTQTQSSKRKYESSKPQNTTKTTQIQTISKRKYESTKKPETVTKTTNVKVQNTSSKYSLQKKQESAAKSAYQEKKTVKKYNIDMSKYNRDTDKLVFTKSSGRYRYKDKLTDKDIINSRKGNSEAKNIKKLEVVEKTEIEEKNKKRLENTSKSTITHTNKAVSSKKTEHAAKNVLASKTKTNISNVNKGYEDRRINKTTTEMKTTTTTTINKGLSNAYKSNVNKNIQNTNSNNKRKANITNISKKVNIVDSYNEGLNLDKYKKEYIDQEIIRNDMSKRYLNNSLSDKRIYNNSNFNNNAFIENRQIKEVYEIQKQEKHQSPKTKLIKKNLGDNYKYYESKFVQSPNENTNINSYTLHQRRNQRVIYGTEEIEIDSETKKMKSYKLKQEGGKHKKKSKKIVKKKMMNMNNMNNMNMPMNINEGNYVVYDNYYQGNYNYNYDMGGDMEDDQYENNIENNYEEDEVIYYQ